MEVLFEELCGCTLPICFSICPHPFQCSDFPCRPAVSGSAVLCQPKLHLLVLHHELHRPSCCSPRLLRWGSHPPQKPRVCNLGVHMWMFLQECPRRVIWGYCTTLLSLFVFVLTNVCLILLSKAPDFNTFILSVTMCCSPTDVLLPQSTVFVSLWNNIPIMGSKEIPK